MSLTTNNNNTTTDGSKTPMIPVQNNGTNTILWDSHVKDQLGMHGTAGEEIATDTAIVRVKPVPPDCLDPISQTYIESDSSSSDSEGEIVADMLTKPLHGQQFNSHRAKLLGMKL